LGAGTKIRLPHAVVMTLLFNRSTDIKEMLDRMTGLTWCALAPRRSAAALRGGAPWRRSAAALYVRG